MRYVEDLSSAEIARKLDLPAAKVRSRLKRGLEMLRREFDRQNEQPEWRLAVAPFVISGNVAPAAPTAPVSQSRRTATIRRRTRGGARQSRRAPGYATKNYIRERIGEIVPLLRECYELAMVGNPDLAGRLTVDFVIDAEEEIGGYVAEAAVPEDSELQDPRLSKCVTETILSVEFTPPAGGGVVRIWYPFMFESVP